METLQTRLVTALQFDGRVSGLTHNFYRYPARFSPEFVRHALAEFSGPDDVVLDPFMGGGTSIVESLAAGRRAIGVDINALACFVTAAKTTPLSPRDREAIRHWSACILPSATRARVKPTEDSRLKNLPERVGRFALMAAGALKKLSFPRQRQFARCALLRTLQWAVDCRSEIPSEGEILPRLQQHLYDMFRELEEFCERCAESNVPRNRITGRRLLVCSPTESIGGLFCSRPPQVSLVVTSPPYPGVHVLYHRWQVLGRRETPAPYWIAGLNDGFPESYYTLGSRKDPAGSGYFPRLTAAYQAIRTVLRPRALVVQLVAFSNTDAQLPLFLRAMEAAGYEEAGLLSGSRNRELWRCVPNRKWYTSLTDERSAAREVLLCHRAGTSLR